MRSISFIFIIMLLMKSNESIYKCPFLFFSFKFASALVLNALVLIDLKIVLEELNEFLCRDLNGLI